MNTGHNKGWRCDFACFIADALNINGIPVTSIVIQTLALVAKIADVELKPLPHDQTGQVLITLFGDTV